MEYTTRELLKFATSTKKRDDMKTLIGKIFLEVIFNWSNIRTNETIMNTLSMETNTFCKRFKEKNKYMHDELIQAHVLALLLLLLMIIIQNNNNTEDTQDNIITPEIASMYNTI